MKMKKNKLLVALIFTLLAFGSRAQKYADCIKAKDICKKDTYTFEKLNGEGRDNFEAMPAPCFAGGRGIEDANPERNSAWIKFTVKEAGSLKFTIKPINRDDDIDFVVYRLDDGNCSEKKIIRCCASGDERYPSPCMGTTGLRDGEEDVREEVGCGIANNSFLRPIKTKAGEVYVILASNVTTVGPGFTIRIYGSCVLPCDEEKPKQPEVAKVQTPKPARPAEVKTEPIAEQIPPVVAEKTKPTPPEEINGRKTVVNKTLAVKSRTITLKVWDNSIEDGDVVSIYVNGKKKFANIELKNKPQEFILDLESGENYITAHAENFGRKEPNTAAISVFDGKKEQKLSLNATKISEESLKIMVE